MKKNKDKTIEVKQLGLLNAFNDWRTSRHEKHVSKMQEMGKCPDCYGRGFIPYPASEFAYVSNALDCPGCNGSGLYTDWNELQ